MIILDKNIIFEAVERFGSPLYLFHIKELRRQITEVKSILGENIKLCYAMKANPFLVSYMEAMVDKFEVCSPGEYAICRKENIDTEKIVMSGVYKSIEDIQSSFRDCFAGVYTIESSRQYMDLHDCAKKNNKRIKALVRLTSGNQFGMDKEEVCRILSETEKDEFVDTVGIHFFSGTQKRNMCMIQKELEEIDDFCEHVNARFGEKIKNIEYGAGLFFDYFSRGKNDTGDMRIMKEMIDKYHGKYQFTIELGRYLSASCGQYITKVVDVKRNGSRNYCIVDGGIHHLNYYGQILGIKVPTVRILREHGAGDKTEKWNVCGALCTVHDMLLKDYMTGKVEIGDVFVFDDVGAYSVTETGYLFLSRNLPRVLVIDDDMTMIRDSLESYHLNSRKMEELI